jgi:ATP-binding cassette, subfamily G (WHITE), member 2
VRYAFTALMTNEFRNRPSIIYNEQPVLEFYGMKGEMPWANVGYMAVFCLGFSCIAFLALRYIRHQKR